VRQVLQYKPVRVVLFDQWEYGVYQLNQHYNFENVHCVLGDIRDEERLLSIMENEKPEIIFHAAAYKHVPLLETNFIEALKTNILGTATLLKSIVHWLSLGKTVGPVKLVNISTDKAVEPENIMGLSKRISELLVYNVAREFGSQDLQTVSVRFGNVLGSSGSVVPLFLEQIHKGLPLTVTHPDMERFFMTIPEAVNLVLHALTVSSGQDILALDMGKSVKILELAERIILLSGYIPHKDIKIEFTGIRPGEKMKEELFWEKDSVRTDNPYIFRSEKDLKVLNVEEFIDKTVEALENNKSLGWFKDYLRQYI
ncbi:MAG: polysaccharide biosynthesis protein, partial [Leptospiraceae bacterium]|nr:polysaccharide biosynthesis protein [Leptospiraceae bacterium]